MASNRCEDRLFEAQHEEDYEWSDSDTAVSLQSSHYYNDMDKKNKKPAKRKRIMDSRQRMAANVRERRRMVEIRKAFDTLGKRLPDSINSRRKKLSRMEILHLSAVYIAMMTKLLLEHNESTADSDRYGTPS